MRTLRGAIGLPVKRAGGAINERLTVIDLDHDINQRVFDRLKKSQRMIKLLAGFGVLYSGLKLPFRGANNICR